MVLCQLCQVSPPFSIGRSLVSIFKPESLIFNLCFLSSKIEKYEANIPKAIIIILPIIFSKAKRSFELLRLLDAGSFRFDPQLPRRFPQENWDQLFSSSYTACKLAVAREDEHWTAELLPIIPDPGAEVGTSSRPRGLNTMSRLKGLFKSSK